MKDGKRLVDILFDRGWGGEDLDDNGVALELVNEQISDIGYKDIAYY